MTISEILAIVFVAGFFIKLLTLILSQKTLNKYMKLVFDNRKTFTVLSVLVLLVVGYYLFQEVSQVDVAAAAVFILMLEAVSFLTHSNFDEMKETSRKIMATKNLALKNWFSLFLWTLFAVWVITRLML